MRNYIEPADIFQLQLFLMPQRETPPDDFFESVPIVYIGRTVSSPKLIAQTLCALKISQGAEFSAKPKLPIPPYFFLLVPLPRAPCPMPILFYPLAAQELQPLL